MPQAEFVAADILAMHVIAVKNERAIDPCSLGHRAKRTGRRGNRSRNDWIIRLVSRQHDLNIGGCPHAGTIYTLSAYVFKIL